MSEGKWTEAELETLFNNAVRKSMMDLEYRKQLIADPTTALAKIDSRPLPSHLRVVFADADEKIVSASLPKPIVSDQLDEAQLEMVAGGVDEVAAEGCTVTCLITCISTNCTLASIVG